MAGRVYYMTDRACARGGCTRWTPVETVWAMVPITDPDSGTTRRYCTTACARLAEAVARA
jgi:hypothetical protein